MDITSDDILGKEAIDPEGAIIGVITKLHIDKKEKKIMGITIDQGFMKPELFIGLNSVKNFGVDTVFLNKVPYPSFKGLKVISSTGKVVGKVKEIKPKRNKVKTLIVATSMTDTVDIPAKQIAQIGHNIILKQGAKI